MKVFIFIHSACSEASTDKNIWHTLQTVYDIFFMHCLLLLNWKCSYNSHFLGQQLSYFVIIRIVVDCPRCRWYGRLKLIIVSIGIILIQQRISVYYTTGKKNGQELELYPAFNSLTVTQVWFVWIDICSTFKFIWCVMPIHICCFIVKLVWNSFKRNSLNSFQTMNIR